jgi:outer membrane receptor protein involved in Fe transport
MWPVSFLPGHFQSLEMSHRKISSLWKARSPSRTRLFGTLFGSWFAATIPAWAADPATAQSPEAKLLELMNTEVSTVSRVSESLDKTPGSVYVFTREMIQQRGYRSLGELLRTVPGFTVFHRDLQYVAGVRGLNANDNEKITLLVNGQNLNNVNEPDFLNGPINLDNVERVEVVVGPSSFFQQANTLAATVNVITRKTDGSEVVIAAGNALKYSATAMTGKQWAEDEFFNFSFTTERKEGFDAWDKFNRPGLANRKITGELDWPAFFSVLNGQYGELSGQFTAYRTSMPELNIDNGDPNNNGRYDDQFYSLSLKEEHAITPELTGMMKADATLKEQTRLNSDGVPANAAEVANKQRVYTAEIGLRYTGLERHLIQTGVQGSYDDNFDSYFTFNVTTPPEHFPKTPLVVRDSHAFGFYVDDEFQLSDKIKLVGGIRADHNTRLDGDRWFPGGRAAIIASPVTNWISKLMYNRAVRMPAPWATQLNDAWGSDKPESPSFTKISTTADAPEKLSTVEWQNIFYLGRARLGATVYHQELEDFISWFEPHSNVGNFRGNGVEVDMQVPVRDDLTAWANASWNDSTLHVFVPQNFTVNQIEQHIIINPENRIIGAPEYTANAGVDYDVTHSLVFSPSVRYFTEQGAYDNEHSRFMTIRNRCYVDATLTWKNAIRKNTDLHLSADNILNNRDPVAGQWLRDTYRPRGAEVVLALDARF